MAIASQQEFPAPAKDHSLERKALTPMDLLSVALHNNAAIDVIERLAALQEKMVMRQAETEFTEAMNRVQSEIKRIAPDMENPQKHNKYATYAAIDRVIRPIYTRESFSLSFSDDESQAEGRVKIICYVSRGPYTRIYRKSMPVDTKGAKGGDVMTETHATGAADSYAKRYLLKDIFNIAVAAEDRDGNPVTMGTLTEKLDRIEKAKTKEELREAYACGYKEAQTSGDRTARLAIIDAYDKRKKEIA